MKINKNFLPLKGHYFFFLGSVSPILPFLMVIARQLGIPIIVQGTFGSIILILIIIAKPVIAGVADTFPKLRKGIFIFLISLMICSYCTIGILPSMNGSSKIRPIITGYLEETYKFGTSSNVQRMQNNSEDIIFLENSTINTSISPKEVFLISSSEGDCHIDEAWDCNLTCLNSNSSECKLLTTVPKISWNSKSENLFYLNKNVFLLEDAAILLDNFSYNIRLECAGGLYIGNECPSLWSNYLFWIYLGLLLIGQISFSISNSISDAICFDSIGPKGEYGSQRVWGTVGWGLMGPISGLLVDYYSGDNVMKDYSPAFLILFIYGIIDIILITSNLKVPHLEEDINVWKTVKPLLKTPRFVVFLFFVILNGSFDGVVASYIFILQEEMAKEKQLSYMRNMKFIQGMTIGVQCFFEAAFMWVLGWFLKRMTATTLTTVVFFLYIFRLFGIALVGSYGPIWATLAVEILNGPCYGLGYTAIVIQANHLTPPGTSATVQSVANICYEALGYSLASFFGAILYTYFGAAGIYYIFGIVSVLTFILHIVASRVLRVLHDDPPLEEPDLNLEEKNEALLPTQPGVVCDTSRAEVGALTICS